MECFPTFRVDAPCVRNAFYGTTKDVCRIKQSRLLSASHKRILSRKKLNQRGMKVLSRGHISNRPVTQRSTDISVDTERTASSTEAPACHVVGHSSSLPTSVAARLTDLRFRAFDG